MIVRGRAALIHGITSHAYSIAMDQDPLTYMTLGVAWREIVYTADCQKCGAFRRIDICEHWRAALAMPFRFEMSARAFDARSAAAAGQSSARDGRARRHHSRR
jgi:hypothetical protein